MSKTCAPSTTLMQPLPRGIEFIMFRFDPFAQSLIADGSTLRTSEGFPEPHRTVNVLFEETFFNSRDESYRVVCIDRPLAGAVVAGAVGAAVGVEVATLEQAEAYLWRVRHDRKVRARIQGLFEQFETAWAGLHQHRGDVGLDQLVDAVNAVYSRALQIVLTQSTHRKIHRTAPKGQSDPLPEAVEVFVMYGLARPVTAALSTV